MKFLIWQSYKNQLCQLHQRASKALIWLLLLLCSSDLIVLGTIKTHSKIKLLISIHVLTIPVGLWEICDPSCDIFQEILREVISNCAPDKWLVKKLINQAKGGIWAAKNCGDPNSRSSWLPGHKQNDKVLFSQHTSHLNMLLLNF